MKERSSQNRVIAILSDGKPRCSSEIAKLPSLSRGAAENALRRLWERQLIQRTKCPLYKNERVFKGRGGVSRNTRPYHVYVIGPYNPNLTPPGNSEFVSFDRVYLDARGGGVKSKAKIILDFIEKNKNQAFFSKDIALQLATEGIKPCDIMANVRRFEKKGLVYVRGYRLQNKQTPFKEGFLITWVDPEASRESAVELAVERTNLALAGRSSTSPIMERVHRIMDMTVEHSKLKDLVSFNYIQEKLGCTEDEAKRALDRAMQLYPKIRKIKLFNAYSYYYHSSLSEEDLTAAVSLKENFIRKTQGRRNRIGHNWEAVAEWFIDKFTVGAHFRSQSHRTKKMDPLRITLHLIKSVGHRRNAAEVDRVWEVSPGVFSPVIIYVLSCKYSLIHKHDIDDFFDVLRWSKEFGVDTSDGRQIKQGVTGVFAGQAFDPTESVKLKDESTLVLAAYSARMNVQLLKAADFNEKLRERGCPKIVSIQRICKIASDEREVRELLDKVWEKASNSEVTLDNITKCHKNLYEFERLLESKDYNVSFADS